jgi:Divergent InlB B-repeat domain
MNGELALTATFIAAAAGGGGGAGGVDGAGGAAATSFVLTVSLANAGTVTSTPAGINCGSTCTARHIAGTAVALRTQPPAGSSFAGWSGACTGTDPKPAR